MPKPAILFVFFLTAFNSLHAAPAQSKIRLLKYHNTCYFFMQGYDDPNHPVNSILWTPKAPHRLFVETTSTEPHTVLSELKRYQQIELKGYRKRWAKHFMMADFGKESYKDLVGISDGRYVSSLFEAQFSKSLLPLLQKEQTFVINLGVKNKKSHLTTQVYLDGFNKVLKAYENQCA